jgi:hypothetical protein
MAFGMLVLHLEPAGGLAEIAASPDRLGAAMALTLSLSGMCIFNYVLLSRVMSGGVAESASRPLPSPRSTWSVRLGMRRSITLPPPLCPTERPPGLNIRHNPSYIVLRL